MLSFCDQMLQCPPPDRNWKSGLEVAPNCPRCASSNTKFCYYNNYSLSQPRYLCKGCRRYWTKGGSLRNVPVGGGCRKSRRGGKSSTTRHDTSSVNSSRKTTLSSFRGDGPGGGPDIDLALVFAKFLNHNSTSTSNFDQSNNSSMEMEFPKPGFPESYPVQEIPQVEQQQEEKSGSIQESLETGEFGLPNLSTDEVVQMQDVLWSDDATKSLEWEPMAMAQLQLQQQFGSSLPLDDQLMISTNYLVNENWSSFDLSGFGVNFSNP